MCFGTLLTDVKLHKPLIYNLRAAQNSQKGAGNSI